MPRDAKALDWMVWPALLVAPLLALGLLSLVYALVTPACARQGGALLHLLCGGSLALCLLMTAVAARAWSRLAEPSGGVSAVTASDGGDAASRPRFVALLATLTGALSALVIVALWVPVWLVPPCS